MPSVTAGGHRLEYAWLGPPPDRAPTLVFLHEGLGSLEMWRDFPSLLAADTGYGGLVYSRWGHGGSDPLDRPRAVGFMHDEALVTLPQVLSALAVCDPILIGHSDGASIALIYTGAHAGPVRGLVLEAPHVFVEACSIESISRIRGLFESTDLKQRLARYHGASTDSMFRAWNDVWLHPDFVRWSIQEYLPPIECPILVVHGEADEYGTVAQVQRILDRVAGPVEAMLIPACGHAPHRDHPELVRRAMARFIQGL